MKINKNNQIVKFIIGNVLASHDDDETDDDFNYDDDDYDEKPIMIMMMMTGRECPTAG